MSYKGGELNTSAKQIGIIQHKVNTSENNLAFILQFIQGI